MKTTDKFNRMIEAFECDFTLARDDNKPLSYFDEELRKENTRLRDDVKLLEELSFLLRYGQAQILMTDGEDFEEWLAKHDEEIKKAARAEAIAEFEDAIRTYADRTWMPVTGNDILSISEMELEDTANDLLGQTRETEEEKESCL